MKDNSHVVTIRTNSQIKNNLVKEAKNKGLNLNNLLNQILRDHYNWHKWSSDADMLMILKDQYIDLLSALDKKQISKQSQKLAKGMEYTILLWYGELNLNTILQAIKIWLVNNKINHKIIQNNKNIFYFINHSLGKNFSDVTFLAYSKVLKKFSKIKLIHKTSKRLDFEIITIS